MTPHYDVIIIGAGISGIGAAYHIKENCPGHSFTILEGRADMGGTWDLFKYPGIRSDSDMYTLGFSFYPWKNPKAIADGPSILEYIKDTAHTFGIDQKIKFNHKVIDASWSSKNKKWEIQIAESEQVEHQKLSCNFLFTCAGYYNYEQGYEPVFKGREEFQGTIIHPQKWDRSLDYQDKKIVVIGSGATAVTLVPELAKKAAEVTMLQRSPTYIFSMPSEDRLANALMKTLPNGIAHTLNRWKNILFTLGFYKASRRWPNAMKAFIKKKIRNQVNREVDMKHFDPDYKPWDQRLCLVPDGDLFEALNSGKAKIVTDTIDRFTDQGILLDSGLELPADIIVTATGLQIQLMGGMRMSIDGEPIHLQNRHCYKGVMLEGIPNFAVAIGYTNASWTLKCDLNCTFVTRLINHMQQHSYSTCTPRFDPAAFDSEPLLDFDAGYVKRALHLLPKQGSRYPWKVYQNYMRDLWALKYDSVKDEYLEYK